MTSRFLLGFAAVSLCMPMVCQAFIDAPTIEPANPTTRLPVTLRVRAGGCDGFYDQPNEAELVRSSGGQLQLIVDGEATLPPGHPFCNWPVFTYRFELGVFEPGSYTVQLLVQDELDFDEAPIAVGSVDFSVASPFVIPAMSWVASAGLVALLALSFARRL